MNGIHPSIIAGIFTILVLITIYLVTLRKTITASNITKREKAELTVITCQFLFEHARESILFIRQQDGRILEANPSALKTYGYSKEELITRTIYELQAGGDRTEVNRKMDTAARNGIAFETMHRSKQGKTFPVEVSSIGAMIGGESVLLSIIRDITVRKQTEEALAAEKESLAVTLRSIGDGVITTDIAGTIVVMNKVAEQLTGWSQEIAIGKPVVKVCGTLDEKTRQNTYNLVEKVLRTGVDLNQTAILRAKDGTEKIIQQSAAPIFDSNNQVVGVVLVFRDITQEQRAKAEILKANKIEALSLLAGGIAHDFNNILTAILGNLSLLKVQTADNTEAYQIIHESEQAALRAGVLTQQLLTFARGGGAPVKKTASVAELIKETTDFALRGSNISCYYSMPSDLWMVTVDKGQISQVMQNLVINAVQAMPLGGVIEVTCANILLSERYPLGEGKYVAISLRDRGEGIAKEYFQRIFDPYFTTKPTGSGLGLATSYTIIKNHGGHIQVESEPGIGTTFTVYLPAISERTVTPIKKEDILPSQGKVLVMDDEEPVRSVLGRMLNFIGFKTVLAKDGAEAITLYQRAAESGQSFDVVIMDLTVPGGMGGREALQKLLHMNPDVKAVVSSGYSSDPIMDDYKKYGFAGAVTKPYKIQELSEILQAVLTKVNNNVKE